MLEYKGVIALSIFVVVGIIVLATWLYSRANQTAQSKKGTKPGGWANFKKFIKNKSILISPEKKLHNSRLEIYQKFAAGLASTLRSLGAQNVVIEDVPAIQPLSDFQIVVNSNVNDEGYVFLMSYKTWASKKRTEPEKFVLKGMTELEKFQIKKMTAEQLQTTFRSLVATVLNSIG